MREDALLGISCTVPTRARLRHSAVWAVVLRGGGGPTFSEYPTMELMGSRGPSFSDFRSSKNANPRGSTFSEFPLLSVNSGEIAAARRGSGAMGLDRPARQRRNATRPANLACPSTVPRSMQPPPRQSDCRENQGSRGHHAHDPARPPLLSSTDAGIPPS